jgi:hypothetical protein
VTDASLSAVSWADSSVTKFALKHFNRTVLLFIHTLFIYIESCKLIRLYDLLGMFEEQVAYSAPAMSIQKCRQSVIFCAQIFSSPRDGILKQDFNFSSRARESENSQAQQCGNLISSCAPLRAN